MYDDVQKEMDTLLTNSEQVTETALNTAFDTLGSTSSISSSTPGISSVLEKRNPQTILQSAITTTANNNGNINISSNAIDSATANVSKKLDTSLEGMCQ